MMDYKKAIGDYLDEVLKRKEFSIDRIKREIKSSKVVCAFGLGMVSYPITLLSKLDFGQFRKES